MSSGLAPSKSVKSAQTRFLQVCAPSQARVRRRQNVFGNRRRDTDLAPSASDSPGRSRAKPVFPPTEGWSITAAQLFTWQTVRKQNSCFKPARPSTRGRRRFYVFWRSSSSIRSPLIKAEHSRDQSSGPEWRFFIFSRDVSGRAWRRQRRDLGRKQKLWDGCTAGPRSRISGYGSPRFWPW